MTLTDRESRRKRVLEDLNKAWLGTVALVVLVVVITATTMLNSLHIGKTSYIAEFLQAASLRTGDQVTVAGVPVGTVSSTALARDRVLVTMKISRDVSLGPQTRAAIKLTTVLGSRYVELKPAGDGQLPDQRIPLAHTTVPYDLQKLLADSTTTFEDVDAHRFAESLQAVSQQLHDVPAILPEALTNVQNLSTIIAARRDQISELLHSTAQVADILGGQRTDLAGLVSQGHQLLGEVVARRNSLDQLLAATTNLVTVVRDVTVDDRAHIEQMLADLRIVTSMMGDHDALLRNLFQTMPISMRNVANAAGTGPFLNFNLPGGLMVDSWMCAISGRAEQFNWPQRYQYFKDCQ
jgi:phospholipid/cholesterol/gamma-HCH transport system substrate-binding protein